MSEHVYIQRAGDAPLFCDKEGVPLLIQGMKYVYSRYVFSVQFFNGQYIDFDAGSACPSMALLQSIPQKMQWLEAENYVTKTVLKNWHHFMDMVDR